MQDVVDELPQYDDPDLDVGLGIKAKRWYVEGDERFDESGGSWTACSRESKPGRLPDGIGATMDALGRRPVSSPKLSIDEAGA